MKYLHNVQYAKPVSEGANDKGNPLESSIRMFVNELMSMHAALSEYGPGHFTRIHGQNVRAYSAWLEMQLCMYSTAFSLMGLPTAKS